MFFFRLVSILPGVCSISITRACSTGGILTEVGVKVVTVKEVEVHSSISSAGDDGFENLVAMMMMLPIMMSLMMISEGCSARE